MILGYDESTFGKPRGRMAGKIISRTVVFLRCDECNKKEWSMFWFMRGRRKGKDKRDICQSCRNRLGLSGMKGKKHSAETIRKSLGRMTGDDNPSRRPEVRKKISEKLLGRDVYWLRGKKRPEHAEIISRIMREKIAKDPEYMKKIFGTKRTHSVLHDTIKNYIERRGITGFVSGVEVGHYVVDECDIERKLIIEINGKFWHADPRLYDWGDFIHDGIRACEIWDFDERKRNYLEGKGFSVLVIWELDWKSNRIQVFNDLLEWINGDKTICRQLQSPVAQLELDFQQ